MNSKGTLFNPVQEGPASMGTTTNWDNMWQQKESVTSGVKMFFEAMTLMRTTCRKEATGSD